MVVLAGVVVVGSMAKRNQRGDDGADVRLRVGHDCQVEAQSVAQEMRRSRYVWRCELEIKPALLG